MRRKADLMRRNADFLDKRFPRKERRLRAGLTDIHKFAYPSISWQVSSGTISFWVTLSISWWFRGRGQPGRYNQPYVEFDRFKASYKAAGGISK
jgi:hypothetical protein